MKLYIGNLPFSASDADLREVFGAHGTVTDAIVMMDRTTGRSRGFGFVEMADEAQAQAAIDRWDGKEYDGRMLSVSMARPQGERPPREGGDRSGYGGGNRGGFGGGDRGGNRGGGYGGGFGGGDRGGY
jgi:RNA recognition motif-containing protein